MSRVELPVSIDEFCTRMATTDNIQTVVHHADDDDSGHG